VEKVGRKQALTLLTSHCMSNLNLFSILTINQSHFNTFMNKIQSGYQKVKYHNDIHGTDVL
jgi:hypothetical protein